MSHEGPKFMECSKCRGEVEVTTPEDVLQCYVCEDVFCSIICEDLHDCLGHEPKAYYCQGCGKTYPLDDHNKPAIIQDEKYCATCAYFRPWEKTKQTMKNILGVRP